MWDAGCNFVLVPTKVYTSVEKSQSQNDVRVIINEEEELVKQFLEIAKIKREHYSSCLFLQLKKYVHGGLPACILLLTFLAF